MKIQVQRTGGRPRKVLIVHEDVQHELRISRGAVIWPGNTLKDFGDQWHAAQEAVKKALDGVANE